mmetsp:Transcript_45688/g.67435  ORF Transcript_45688/g.67435 Transcript_45688/m.67435 type:complete len:210 (+) Transcript_45688:680-1309(+)
MLYSLWNKSPPLINSCRRYRQFLSCIDDTSRTINGCGCTKLSSFFSRSTCSAFLVRTMTCFCITLSAYSSFVSLWRTTLTRPKAPRPTSLMITKSVIGMARKDLRRISACAASSSFVLSTACAAAAFSLSRRRSECTFSMCSDKLARGPSSVSKSSLSIANTSTSLLAVIVADRGSLVSSARSPKKSPVFIVRMNLPSMEHSSSPDSTM